MPAFQPLASYNGYQHILMAGATFVHPGNGSVYFCACEQRAGAKQDLSVYRIVGGGSTPELVRRYQGTVDSQAHITYGSAVIGQGGALIVATSLILPGAERITGTGFQGCWIRESGVDEAWGPWLTENRLGAIEQRLLTIEAALAHLSGGGLDARDREALDRLVAMIGL